MSGGRLRVEFAPAAHSDLRQLPPGDAARLRGPILALGMGPHQAGSQKLVDIEFWRLRVGDLRVIYLVDDPAGLVVILKVARRSESTYRGRRVR